MAIINKTGITDGGTIQAAHVTRAIDALSGVGTDTIIATGSFTGSFTGNAGITNLQIGTNGYSISQTGGIVFLNATNNSLDTQIKHRNGIISSSFSNSGLLINAPVTATSFTGSLLGTLTGTASFAVSSSRAVSSSFATTASFALNAGATFPFTGSAVISGSLQVIGATRSNGSFNVVSTNISNATSLSIEIGALPAGSTTLVDLSVGANTITINLANPSTYQAGSEWAFLFTKQPDISASFELVDSDSAGRIFGNILDISGTGVPLTGVNTVTSDVGYSRMQEIKVEVVAADAIWFVRITDRDATTWTVV